MSRVSCRWWFNAVILGRIDTEKHPQYIDAKAQVDGAAYLQSRLDDIREQSELVWKLADEGLLRIHDRMDRTLVTSLAIFGLIVSSIKAGHIQNGSGTIIAIVLLIIASIVLLISRLPINRYTPTSLELIAADSCNIDPDEKSDWQFLMAKNYYLAKIECDIAAFALASRMQIVIGLIAAALLALGLPI